MMTSRSEYRLLLRRDNADNRLTAIGHRLGLVSGECLAAVEEKYRAVDREIRRLASHGLPPSAELNEFLESRGTAPVHDGASLLALLRRPQVRYGDLRRFDPDMPGLPPEAAGQGEISVKYEGYIQRQGPEGGELRRGGRRCGGGGGGSGRRAGITPLSRACGWRPGRSWPPSAPWTWARPAEFPVFRLPT